MKLSDLNLFEVGNTIQLSGAIYSGPDRHYLCFFPGKFEDLEVAQLEMESEDWKTFLAQADKVETEILMKGPDGKIVKAIFRKCQRQIDQAVSWQVYRRDSFRCRYCGTDQVPLTVDHLVLWEEGGPSTPENLVSSCRKCNGKRGSMPYAKWLKSKYYTKVSKKITGEVKLANEALVPTLERIPRVLKQRSR